MLIYDRLAEGQNDLAGRHAYSHVNSLCSAMQAYLTLGSEKHFRRREERVRHRGGAEFRDRRMGSG